MCKYYFNFSGVVNYIRIWEGGQLNNMQLIKNKIKLYTCWLGVIWKHIIKININLWEFFFVSRDSCSFMRGAN